MFLVEDSKTVRGTGIRDPREPQVVYSILLFAVPINMFSNLVGGTIPQLDRDGLYWNIISAGIVLFVLTSAVKMIYRVHMHPLRSVPGPWISSATSLWIRWQRWHGRLSFEADKLMAKYGPIVRISPNLVILNDPESVEKVFIRKDLDTSPTSIRALRVGGHDWTVTYPQHPVARSRRHPVMIATTTKNLKLRHQVFVDYIEAMVRDLAKSGGKKSEDIVHHLRICTLKNSQVIMGGSAVDIDTTDFPAWSESTTSSSCGDFACQNGCSSGFNLAHSRTLAFVYDRVTSSSTWVRSSVGKLRKMNLPSTKILASTSCSPTLARNIQHNHGRTRSSGRRWQDRVSDSIKDWE